MLARHPTRWDCSALHVACKHGHLEVAVFLAERGGQKAVDDLDSDGNPPHMVAFDHDHLHIVEHLLATFEIDIDRAYKKPLGDFYEVTALSLAVFRSNEEAVKLLLKHGANPNKSPSCYFGSSLVHLCTKHLSILTYHTNQILAILNTLKLLLEHGANVNAQDNEKTTPLFQACDADREGFVQVLLEAGADTEITDHEGFTAFSRTVMNMNSCPHQRLGPLARPGCRVRVLELLVAHGASVSNQEQATKALLHACNEGPGDLVRVLVASGACVNVTDDDGNTPLILICLDQWLYQWLYLCRDKRRCQDFDDADATECVRKLLAAGCNVNAQNNRGKSALHEAIRARKPTIAKLLVESGADANIPDKDGCTALHHACAYSGSVDLVLDAGADFELRDNDGKTSLHHACFACSAHRLSIVQELVTRRGANVNAIDKKGDSPLLIVLKKGGQYYPWWKDIVRLLVVEAGADLHHANLKGYNALSTVAAWDDVQEDDCRFILDLDDLVIANQGAQALLAAGTANHANLVRFLLQAHLERGLAAPVVVSDRK